MKKSSIEVAVGIFVLIGILCVGYLTIRLGKMELIGGNHYILNARFQSVSGLKAGSQVEIAGVKVGQVDAVDLDPVQQVALVRLKIDKSSWRKTPIGSRLKKMIKIEKLTSATRR